LFLTGSELSKAISDIIKGENLKCAVAYWGNHPFCEEIERLRDAQIICDIHSGATSVEALKKLGAPESKKLKYLARLHAKVYISNKGLIICSANASRNALGSKTESPKLKEAGAFFPITSDEWMQASQWFNELFLNNAVQVDPSALEVCGKLRSTHTEIASSKSNSTSLLDRLDVDPEFFWDMDANFVFSSTSTSPEDRKRAEEDFEIEHNPLAENLKNDSHYEYFTDWVKLDIEKTNTKDRIINIHREGEEISISLHEIKERLVSKGHFITEKINEEDVPFSLKLSDKEKNKLSNFFEILTPQNGYSDEGHAIMTPEELCVSLSALV
jgi:hypothetical protein